MINDQIFNELFPVKITDVQSGSINGVTAFFYTWTEQSINPVTGAFTDMDSPRSGLKTDYSMREINNRRTLESKPDGTYAYGFAQFIGVINGVSSYQFIDSNALLICDFANIPPTKYVLANTFQIPYDSLTVNTSTGVARLLAASATTGGVINLIDQQLGTGLKSVEAFLSKSSGLFWNHIELREEGMSGLGNLLQLRCLSTGGGTGASTAMLQLVKDAWNSASIILYANDVDEVVANVFGAVICPDVCASGFSIQNGLYSNRLVGQTGGLNSDAYFTSGILTSAGSTPFGSAASQSSSFFLQVANNLSDVGNAVTARSNLGLGSAATQNTSYFCQTANNLSDVSNAATARSNLGLGTAAVQADTYFFQAVANQASDVGALTDSTGGTATSTLNAVSGTGDDTTINDNIASLTAQLNSLRSVLQTAGLMA